MMANPNNPSLLFLIISVCLLSPPTSADFEVCNPGESKSIYRFTKKNCPFGVLFYHPITAGCLSSTNSEGHFISDLCEPESYTIKSKDGNNTEPYKLQLAFIMDEEPVEDIVSCSGSPANNKCNTSDLIDVTPEMLTEPEEISCDSDDDIDDEASQPAPTEADIARRSDPRIFNQTERMFKYMLGLFRDTNNAEFANIRLMKLIRQCFKILSTFCDARYVPLDFGKDVLKAFMFLFRESDLSGFIDITVEGYLEIKAVLDECEKHPPKFKLVGNSCRTCPNVYSVEKGGKSMRYLPNEFSFKWGQYDIPVDATWGAITFVHGFCYNTYRPNVNFHHHFQREAERLFTKEIRYRWNKPVILNHEDLWDHLFSSNIKNTMRNLDACIIGAYHGTPFKHQLERPFIEQGMGGGKNGSSSGGGGGGGNPGGTPSSGTLRRKRSLPTMKLEDGGLGRAGWCFQSEEDLILTTEAYVNSKCPDNKKALEEVKEVVECLASTPDSDESLEGKSPSGNEGGGDDGGGGK